MAQAQAIMDQELVAACAGEQCDAARGLSIQIRAVVWLMRIANPQPPSNFTSQVLISAAHLEAIKGQVSTLLTSRCG